MSEKLSGRLESTFVLLSPLSHIGSSIGPDSYLSTQQMLDAEGRPAEVFVYSGNALRGMWRDAGARYMLEKLGNGKAIQVPLDVFYLMFSGGSIGGEQSIDIDQARRIRARIPHLSIFGGGVGNMILPGKLAVGEGLPVCRELAHIIPDKVPGDRTLSWRQMIAEISYTRTDDAKNEHLRPFVAGLENPALDAPKQMGMLPGAAPEPEVKGKKEQPQQMRYTIEVLCRGAVLWQETTYQDMTDIELGAFTAAIAEWSKRPHLGGQARIGMGKVKVEMAWQPWGEAKEPFLAVTEGECLLFPPAKEAKMRYDEFLAKYAAYLEEHKDGIVQAISGKVS